MGNAACLEQHSDASRLHMEEHRRRGGSSSWPAGSSESSMAQLEELVVLTPAPFLPVGKPGERLERANEWAPFDENGDTISPSWLTFESVMSFMP